MKRPDVRRNVDDAALDDEGLQSGERRFVIMQKRRFGRERRLHGRRPFVRVAVAFPRLQGTIAGEFEASDGRDVVASKR